MRCGWRVMHGPVHGFLVQWKAIGGFLAGERRLHFIYILKSKSIAGLTNRR